MIGFVNYFQMVKLIDRDFHLIDDLIEWLDDYAMQEYDVVFVSQSSKNNSNLVFSFRERTTALLFKLTWLD